MKKDLINVCHLTSVHSRYDTRIFYKQCRSLVKSGCSVHLIVADGKGDEIRDGIHIYDVGKSSGRLRRMIKTTKSVYKKALILNMDIYHLHDPELLPYSLKLKKKEKIVIFDSHEDVPKQIRSTKTYIPFLIRKFLSYLYCKYESKILRKLDALISVSPDIVERLKCINHNTVMITNYPAVNEIIQNTEIAEQAICFAGLISPLWMHTNILAALSLLNNVIYHLAGTAEPKYLKKMQKNNMWERVNFVGKIPANEVLDFMRKSAAGMALCDYVEEVGYNMGTLGNTKLFEYMQAGIPIICTDFILWKQIIEEEKCGICVNPRDKKSIADAIEYIISNPEKAKEMGISGQNAVKERYNWATQEKILLNLYQNLS